MDRIKQMSKRTEVCEWFKRKHKRADPFHFSSEASDDYEDESDDYTGEALTRSLERIITKNLRIFVGTWNVGGRSPVGSLTVDLDEWLNLNPMDAADLYVLGFQEIVPLTTRSIIGAEDPTQATNWSRLIGKTLNDKYGCPWLTPTLNSVSSDNYHYTMTPQSERLSFSSHPGNPIRECRAAQYEKPYEGSKYKLMASKKMVGVFISVWMKKELLRKYCISNVKVRSVPCGIMGWLGNKGSVSVSMSIEGTTFCFIAAHLASGEKKGDEVRRNRQVSKIFRRTTFPRSSKDDDIPQPVSILGHDNIFWLGDLNYRLYVEDNFARNLIKKQDWRALQEFDQLRKELEDGGVFQGWSEGNIEFAPTYKYSASYFNRYSGSLPSRSGEKQRTPAWCDRILWYGKGVRQLSYFRSESKFSDHRPVSALFSIQVEVVKSSNPRIIATHTILPRTSTSKPSIPSNSEEKAKSTLLSLIAKDIEGEASLTYKKKVKKKRKEESPQ